MTQTTIPARAWALLLVLAFIWGSSFLTTTTLVETMAPLHVVTHRVLWAAVFLWVYVAARRLPLPRDAGTIGALLVMGALNNALPFLLQAYAQTTIESGLAGILNATTAIIGPVIAAIFLADERLTPRKAIGVTLGFLGVSTVIGLHTLTELNPRSLAQLAMLASTMAYALAGVWARKRLGHLRPEDAALGMLTSSTLIMLPLSWALVGPLPLISLSAPTLLALGYYGLIITSFAFLLYYHVIRMAGAGNTTLVTLLVAPVAVVLGALVRHETLPVTAFAGFALIAAGLVVLDGRVLKWFRQRRDVTPRTPQNE
ncbi:MAG: DMT family transporter [Maritimibacter sp.]